MWAAPATMITTRRGGVQGPDRSPSPRSSHAAVRYPMSRLRCGGARGGAPIARAEQKRSLQPFRLPKETTACPCGTWPSRLHTSGPRRVRTATSRPGGSTLSGGASGPQSSRKGWNLPMGVRRTWETGRHGCGASGVVMAATPQRPDDRRDVSPKRARHASAQGRSLLGAVTGERERRKGHGQDGDGIRHAGESAAALGGRQGGAEYRRGQRRDRGPVCGHEHASRGRRSDETATERS
jgi:hypothetical protein